MSLLGFLFGPGLNALADFIGLLAPGGPDPARISAQVVIILTALLGATMMLGLSATLPASRAPIMAARYAGSLKGDRTAALWWLSGALTFVLAGFELGIVLQGQQHANLSPREVAIMFAECSLVMLAVDALLFFPSLLDKTSARLLMV